MLRFVTSINQLYNQLILKHFCCTNHFILDLLLVFYKQFSNNFNTFNNDIETLSHLSFILIIRIFYNRNRLQFM